MARPLKTGLDYFPLDVYMDDDVELLEAECGLEGFAILIKLWQKIYSEGYYIEWNRDTSLLFSRKISAPFELVCRVVDVCLQREIFSHALYTKYSILTSSGVQKRYLIACNQAKRKVVPMVKNYLLVDGFYNDYITEIIELIPEETPVNSGVIPEETSLTMEESTQRKGKEKKRKEIESIHVEIIEYLNQKAGKNFSPNTKETVKLISGRLNEGRTLEDFKNVIDKKCNDWKGKIGRDNKPLEDYLRPATLFAQSNFESYLNETAGGNPVLPKPSGRKVATDF